MGTIVRPLTIFIGHDGREKIATDICEASLLEHSSAPLAIHRLVEPALRHSQIYRRDWIRTPEGQRLDSRDRKPFSTDFSFTRFIVPTLMQHAGWALFVDADFLFLDDIAKVFAVADQKYAVMVVQHGVLNETGTKMDGMRQEAYFRKNWSSLVLWNCGHSSNQRLTPYQVNGMSGQWLHGFSWLQDSEIGALSPLWNWLSGIDPQPVDCDPAAVHFTRGIPDMPGYHGSPYAEHWRKVKSRL